MLNIDNKICEAVCSRDLTELASLLKSPEIKSRSTLDIKVALIKAIGLQYWEIALLLLSAKKAYLSTFFLTELCKYKKNILSAENLKNLYFPAEILKDALKKENNIGMLAYAQRGIRKPHISRGSLAIISQELASIREEHKLHQEDILSKFELAVAIDNNHRGEAKESAKSFIRQLKIWFSQARKLSLSQIEVIYDIMKTISMLMDKGFYGSSHKKSKYRMLIPIKINFNSKKVIKRDVLGHYKDKHGVHIADMKSISQIWYINSHKLSLLEVVMHELTHLMIGFMYNSSDPQPKHDWENLAKSIQEDFLDFKEELPLEYERLNYFAEYTADDFAKELATHLVEFFIKTYSLPKNSHILSEKNIAEINRLFALFHKHVVSFKNDLVKLHQSVDEGEYPSRFKLFDYLQKGKLDDLGNYLTKDNYRAYNIMPLHLGDLEIIKYFEAHGFPLNLPDKLGVTPLEAAIATGKFPAAVYIISELIKNGDPLPSSFNVNLRDKQGKTLLIHAIESKAADNLIEILVLYYKAEANTKDNAGKIAVEYAIENKMNLNIVNLLADQLSSSHPIMTKVDIYRKWTMASSTTTPSFDYAELDDSPPTLSSSFPASPLSP